MNVILAWLERLETLILLALARLGATAAGIIIRPSWRQATWFIDPQNTSGLADDNNSGLTALTPVRTYNGGVAAKWGTYAPRIRQNTTITFMSGHTDATDPVIFRPYVENGALIVITAVLPAPAQSGVLANVTSKNRAVPQLLQADLGAGGVAGQMIENTTKPSRAFLYKNVAGVTWSFTQPLVPKTPPSVTATEVDTWANGDAFNVYNLIRVCIVDVEPVHVDFSATVNNFVTLYQLAIFDQPVIGETTIGAMTGLIEVNRGASFIGMTSLNSPVVPAFLNSWGTQGVVMTQPNFVVSTFQTTLKILGGRYGVLVSSGASGPQLDADVILDSALAISMAGVVGKVFLASGTTLVALGPMQVPAGGIVWGAGTINVAGSSRFIYPAGAGAAVAAFLQTGGLRINNLTTAQSLVPGAPDVTNSGIALTPANLDAAAGVAGFGGLAFEMGGGSIVNAAL